MRISKMCPKRVTGRTIVTLALAWMGVALAAVFWLATSVTAARANGGVTKVFRAKQGPYEIVVGIIPPTPTTGVVHFTVTLAEVGTGRPIPQATVHISAQGPQGSTDSTVAATNAFGTSPFYDTNIAVDKPGEWQFHVAVDSPLGKESMTFPLRVQQVTVNWGAIAAILVAILLVLPLVVLGYRSLRGQGQARPRRQDRNL